ncbi:MAG: hypothetical protein ACOX9R_07490 [Armatimonadota bacterium]|jgi:hypothetical protein
MVRYVVITLVLAMLVTALPALAQEDAAEQEPKVNMTAQQWNASTVAAELEKQTGVQVAVTEWSEGSLTGTLKDFALEDAVSSLGRAAGLSWLRFYMLETAPPDEAYTAAELIAKLTEARTEFLQNLTPEQRASLFGGMRGPRAEDGERPDAARPGDEAEAAADGEGAPAAEGEGAPAAEGEGAPQPEAAGERGPRAEGERGGPGFGMNMEGPGGAIARPAPREGAEGDEGQRAEQWGGRGMMDVEDPVRGLLLAGRTDTITLDLTDAPLADALTEFMLKSRFIVVADEGLTGSVSVQLEDGELSEALDAIAEAAGAQWRTVYIASTPRQLTEQEIAQREAVREERRNERFNQQWSEFWQQPAQQRAADMQQRVERMERMAERMAQRRAEDPRRGARMQGRMQRGMERMLTRMMNYTERLTPEQRLELKPYLQAMSRATSGQ